MHRPQADYRFLCGKKIFWKGCLYQTIDGNLFGKLKTFYGNRVFWKELILLPSYTPYEIQDINAHSGKKLNQTYCITIKKNPLKNPLSTCSRISDAFCHISRVSDEYIESINDDFCKIGDILEEKIRVIDIDRSKKRITVSLQSDSRIADEKRSEDACMER